MYKGGIIHGLWRVKKVEWWNPQCKLDSVTLHLAHGLRPMKKSRSRFAYMRA